MTRLTQNQQNLISDLKAHNTLSVGSNSPDIMRQFETLEKNRYARLINKTAGMRKYQYVGPELRQNMSQFEDYLSEKWDYISKFDMCKNEIEARQDHHLSLAEAISVWNRLF